MMLPSTSCSIKPTVDIRALGSEVSRTCGVGSRSASQIAARCSQMSCISPEFCEVSLDGPWSADACGSGGSLAAPSLQLAPAVQAILLSASSQPPPFRTGRAKFVRLRGPDRLSSSALIHVGSEACATTCLHGPRDPKCRAATPRKLQPLLYPRFRYPIIAEVSLRLLAHLPGRKLCMNKAHRVSPQ